MSKNRELCMLADTYDVRIHRTAGMWVSEKLDGMRCLWLPATKGKAIAEVPFANRDKDIRDHVCTGLWSRLGKPIMCPPWFTMNWPDYPLDGELWGGRGRFQDTMSTVRKLEPVTTEWLGVKYMVFEAPQYGAIFADGRINNPNYKKTINCNELVFMLAIDETKRTGYTNTFDVVFRTLQRDLKATETLQLHKHTQLPFNTEAAVARLMLELDAVTDAGGEGLMLRHPGSEWEPRRSKFLLKVKRLQDAEGVVVGYRAGQGKHHGRLGSLTVNWQHGQFELAGFTDEERELSARYSELAAANPGELLPMPTEPHDASDVFPFGSTVTFRFRELTDANVPKEGRYWRKHSA